MPAAVILVPYRFAAKLTSIQRIPSNVKFQRLDIETDWQLGTGSWDLIHIRCLNGAVRSWPSLYTTVYKHLIPGIGHIEHLEIDWKPLDGAGPHLVKWSQTLFDCMDRAGRPLWVSSDLTTKSLEEAGFVDVRVSQFHVPLSGKRDDSFSPRSFASVPLPPRTFCTEYGDGEEIHGSVNDIEAWFPDVFEQWLEGLTLMSMLRAGYNLEAIYHLLACLRQELKNPLMQANCTM